MSEMAEIFSDLKELSQRKRADNRKASASILSRSGVVFENKIRKLIWFVEKEREAASKATAQQ